MTKEEKRYLPLVRTVAEGIKKNLSAEIPMDELMRTGMEGLRVALSRFATRHGTTFRMFAQYHVRGAIYKEVCEHDDQNGASLGLRRVMNELMHFRSEAAEAAAKRSVTAEVTELKELIQCLVPVWLMYQDLRGELSSRSAKALRAALQQLDDQQRHLFEESFRNTAVGRMPALHLRTHWKVIEKIRASLTRKFAEKSADKL